MSVPISPTPARWATRAEALEPFLAMEVLERAAELERAGIDIAHLELGEPEFAPPAAASRAVMEALARDETGYTDSRGLWPLREAIAEDLERRFGQSVTPERVLVTQGTSRRVAAAARLRRGDSFTISIHF